MAKITITVCDAQYRRLKSSETQYVNLPEGQKWEVGDTLEIKNINPLHKPLEKRINIMGKSFAFIGSVPYLV